MPAGDRSRAGTRVVVPDSPALQFRISEYTPLNMVGAEHPRSPELRREGVAECEDGGEAPAGGGEATTQQSGKCPRRRV